MITPGHLSAQGPEEYVWPISIRWRIFFAGGETQQTIAVEAPLLQGNVEASNKLGGILWARSVAAATSATTQLVVWETVCWNTFPLPQITFGPPVPGSRLALPAPREDSGVIMMHSGHADRMAMRPVFLPGIPRGWVDGRLLNNTGLGELESLSHSMAMGMMGRYSEGPLTWLMEYPKSVDPYPGNVHGIAFRKVEYLRVMHHTDRAPDPAPLPWF